MSSSTTERFVDIDDRLFRDLARMSSLSHRRAHASIRQLSDPSSKNQRFWLDYEAFCFEVQVLVRAALERGLGKCPEPGTDWASVETRVATSLYAALCKFDPEQSHTFPRETLPEKQTEAAERKAFEWYRSIIADWVRCACEGSEDIGAIINWQAPGWLMIGGEYCSSDPTRRQNPEATLWIWSNTVAMFRGAINNSRCSGIDDFKESAPAGSGEASLKEMEAQKTVGCPMLRTTQALLRVLLDNPNMSKHDLRRHMRDWERRSDPDCPEYPYDSRWPAAPTKQWDKLWDRLCRYRREMSQGIRSHVEPFSRLK